MNMILDKIISPEQAGFMKGKDATEQILIANEMVHLLEKRERGSNMLLIMDITKVFDRADWSYLEALLLQMGFSGFT